MEMFIELPTKIERMNMLRQNIKVNAPHIDKNVPNNFPMPQICEDDFT